MTFDQNQIKKNGLKTTMERRQTKKQAQDRVVPRLKRVGDENRNQRRNSKLRKFLLSSWF